MCLGELVSAWDWKSVCVSFSAENLTEGDWQLCADAFWFKNAFFFLPQRANKTQKNAGLKLQTPVTSSLVRIKYSMKIDLISVHDSSKENLKLHSFL